MKRSCNSIRRVNVGEYRRTNACAILNEPRIENQMLDAFFYSNSVGREVYQRFCETRNGIKSTPMAFGNLRAVRSDNERYGCKAIYGKDSEHLGDFHTHPTQRGERIAFGSIFSSGDMKELLSISENKSVNPLSRNVFSCVAEAVKYPDTKSNPRVKISCIDSDTLKFQNTLDEENERISGLVCFKKYYVPELKKHTYIKTKSRSAKLLGMDYDRRVLLFRKMSRQIYNEVDQGKRTETEADTLLRNLAKDIQLDVGHPSRIDRHKRRNILI